MGSIFSSIMTVRQVDHISRYWNPKRKLGVSIWRKTLNRHFFKKMIKSYFFPKFRSVHVNWRKCNDNSATRFQNKQQMITWQLLFIRLFFKYQHHWEDISSYLSPRVCLKNSVNDIFPENQKLIVCWVG